jgi:hypothetical protein
MVPMLVPMLHHVDSDSVLSLRCELMVVLQFFCT